MNETILEEAQRLVHGDRQTDYGHPYDDFSRTAQIWTAILGHDVSPQQVALCMVGVKISRECNHPKRDNRTDGAGYFATLDMVEQRLDEIHSDEVKQQTFDVKTTWKRVPPLPDEQAYEDQVDTALGRLLMVLESKPAGQEQADAVRAVFDRADETPPLLTDYPPPYKWVDWDGGNCPINGDEIVEVELRDGSIRRNNASYFVWTKLRCDLDIVRYRIVMETPHG